MPFLGPGQGGCLPQMEPWSTGGQETPEPDAAWWAPHTILPLPSCTESYKRMAPSFPSSVGICWAGGSSKGIFSTRGMGFASRNRTNHSWGPAAMPPHCPSTVRGAGEGWGHAPGAESSTKHSFRYIYTKSTGRKEGGREQQRSHSFLQQVSDWGHFTT